MNATGRLADAVISGLVRVLCRIDGDQLEKVPARGPLILVTNHINFLEIPVVHSGLRPRRLIGLAKAEVWDNPVLKWLFDQWEAIPIRRGESDIGALRRALGALESEAILVLAPEGTRSEHGRLQRGHTGIVTIALRSQAPLLPLVFHGGETFRRNVRRLRRTPFHIVVGEPFHLETGDERVARDVRQQITDEVMYRLAALLPPAYRGYYADLDAATEKYIRMIPT
ncbi:MAG: lysophospholipid acyltransferase family protein [Candidatus Bipolaricaulia bacterium]